MTGQELYLYILNSNLINFIIMVSILVVIFKKAKLGKIIDSMAEDIKTNVTTSAEAVQKVLGEYKKIKKESRTLDEKKQKIITHAENLIKKLNETTDAKIKEKQTKLESNAENTKQSYKERKMQKTALDIQEIVYVLAMEAVKNNMNNEIQEKLVSSALNEFDKIEGVLK